MSTAATDPIAGSETWTARFTDAPNVSIRVDRHEAGPGVWYYAHATGWPGVPHALHFSGNTAQYAVERLIAGALGLAQTEEVGCGFRDVSPIAGGAP